MSDWPVYMDYNATTPCDPQVLETMWPYFNVHFGNAASHTHAFGWTAREAVAVARRQVAGLIGSEPEEIVFTSGATEAVNLALKGVFELYARKGNHIITCKTEHKAVLDTCRALEKKGADITYLQADREGHIDLQQLKDVFKEETILVALMYANNETGVLHPVREISRLAREHGCLFFSDATQAVGKIPVDISSDGIDLMSFSGHKMYGPKGIGALFMRRKKPRARVQPQMDGGGHENGFRSGTLNVPAIVGFGKAAALCEKYIATEYDKLTGLRDKLEQALMSNATITVNGDAGNRLPNVTNLAFKGYKGNDLIQIVNRTAAVSSGSACTSARPEPSHVLLSMGLEEKYARNSLRFSLGRYTTEEEVDRVVAALKPLVTGF